VATHIIEHEHRLRIALPGHGHDHSLSKKTGDFTTVNLSKHAGQAHTTALSTTSPSRDLGTLGVLIHLIGDAINNIAVMVSAGVFMATSFIYTDPIASAFVGVMILATAGPVVFKSGQILLGCAPMEVDIDRIELDITGVEGIESVHELHVWNLSMCFLPPERSSSKSTETLKRNRKR
jgi:zinc transporter 1